MSHHDPAFLLSLLFAASAAIPFFGKPRKPEPEPNPLPDVFAEEAERTLTPLATFTLGDDPFADRLACNHVWDALGVGERGDVEPDETRFFAVSAFDASRAGRDGGAQIAAEIARNATERGFSVLLVDADVSLGLLHQFSLFAPRDPLASKAAPGVSEFLRGESGRLEPMLKLAWQTEGLLLLPAGAFVDAEQLQAASTEKLLRSAMALAEIVIINAPPVFGTDDAVSNANLLPRMDGVLIVYPTGESAATDTKALSKLSVMGVPQVGAVIAPLPPETIAEAKPEPVAYEELPPTVVAVYIPVPEPEPSVKDEAIEPVAFAEPEPIEAEPESEPVAEIVPPAPVATPRPSFMESNPAPIKARRNDSRRAVPVEAVPVYSSPVAPPRPAAPPATAIPMTADPLMNTNTATTYRPDVSLELIPATGESSALTLRAEVGGTGTGAKMVLEIRTVADQAKRLRADNPGENGDALLIIQSLTAETAPEDATVMRLIVRESGSPDAATLLEATLETPDALRIKSGKASTAGVPPVRFEVTTEPDDTARFRATVPALGDAPALFADLERTTTSEGRWSRIVLRLAA